MSELPTGWTICPIKEIATIQSGIGFPEKYQGKHNEKYPVYKVGDISRAYLNANGLLALAANYVSVQIAAELKGKTFPIGSTVFAKIGEALKLNRRVYVIKEGLADNNVMGVIPDLSESNKYIYRFLQNFNIAGLSRSTTVPSIRKTDLEEIEVWLAPLNEQIRIANKLDGILAKVDAAQARLDKIPTLLKRFRQSVLAAATSGELTKEWREKNPFCAEDNIAHQVIRQIQNKKITWTNLNPNHNEVSRVKKRVCAFFEDEKIETAGLPDHWAWAKLEDVVLMVVDCHNKTAPYENNGIALVRTTNIRDGRFIWDDLRYVSEATNQYWSKRCSPEPGDIVFTREAPMGEAAIIPEGAKICLGQRTMLFRPIEDQFSAKFLLITLMDPCFRERSENIAVGTGVKHYRVGDVSELIIPVPPVEEQEEIVRRVDSLFAQADAVEKQYRAAKQRIDRLTHSLLAKAFRGELVPQDPNDEPASELLKRIQAERQTQARTKSPRKTRT